MVEFSIELALARCAAIEDELESLGIKKLRDEQEQLKKSIKAWLIEAKLKGFVKNDVAYHDEESNWEAILSERTKDEWNLSNFRDILSNKQQKRYIKEQVDKEAIKDGISNGDLSRAKLENGSVVKVHQSYALYVRERTPPQEPYIE